MPPNPIGTLGSFLLFEVLLGILPVFQPDSFSKNNCLISSPSIGLFSFVQRLESIRQMGAV